MSRIGRLAPTPSTVQGIVSKHLESLESELMISFSLLPPRTNSVDSKRTSARVRALFSTWALALGQQKLRLTSPEHQRLGELAKQYIDQDRGLFTTELVGRSPVQAVLAVAIDELLRPKAAKLVDELAGIVAVAMTEHISAVTDGYPKLRALIRQKLVDRLLADAGKEAQRFLAILFESQRYLMSYGPPSLVDLGAAGKGAPTLPAGDGAFERVQREAESQFNDRILPAIVEGMKEDGKASPN